ncbi:MAG: hypothetical protein NTZ17_11460 [Phycisphaerae bacterium]|nr:hypothetical protein [Phycisphaerae bacterium]
MSKWKRRNSGSRGNAPEKNRERGWLGPGGFFLTAPATVLLLLAAIAGGALESTALEQTLGAIREGMAKSPAPWPQAWQEEYVDTIRQVIGSHQDAPQYTPRLEIIREGFPPYWEGLKKGKERSLFEVHCAEIRWYVESLMTMEVPTPNDRQKLRDQWRALMDDAAASLVTQFPFLDPNVVQGAKADYLARCYRAVEAPLVPTLRHAFSEEQIGQLKERWTQLRYARVDLWRQFGGKRGESAGKPARVAGILPAIRGRDALDTPDGPSGKTHPDYVLTERSLDQLRGQVWSLIPAPPEYYRNAVAQEIAAQRQRLQAQAEARTQEGRLGVAVWQTEYLSFLLAALLETSEIAENAATGGDKSDEL